MLEYTFPSNRYHCKLSAIYFSHCPRHVHVSVHYVCVHMCVCVGGGG